LEAQLEKNGISVPPCNLPILAPFSPTSSQHGKSIKQEPLEELNSFSPSSTPQAATKIASSLQEMQITSPLGVGNHHHHTPLLKLSPHPDGSQFMIGSAPSDMASYLHGNGQNNNSPTAATLNFLQQQRQQQPQQQPMEFGETKGNKCCQQEHCIIYMSF
jgi:hypothetical protein